MNGHNFPLSLDITILDSPFTYKQKNIFIQNVNGSEIGYSGYISSESGANREITSVQCCKSEEKIAWYAA